MGRESYTFPHPPTLAGPSLTFSHMPSAPSDRLPSPCCPPGNVHGPHREKLWTEGSGYPDPKTVPVLLVLAQYGEPCRRIRSGPAAVRMDLIQNTGS